MSQDGKQQDQPINWLVVMVFGLFHIGAVLPYSCSAGKP